MLLAIESTDRGGSLALAEDRSLLQMEFEHNPRTHSERLMPTIDRMLERVEGSFEDLESIAVCVGPGSFTAIRLGVTTAKTLAMVCGADLISATTLELLAQFACGQPRPVYSVIDARRGELYTQRFRWREGAMRIEGDARIQSPGQLRESLRDHTGAPLVVHRPRDWRPDPSAWPDSVTFYPTSLTSCLAASLVHVARRKRAGGQVENPDAVRPFYLRKSDAQKSREEAVS